MVHVSVGTANGVCGALNAAREFVPMLFTAGGYGERVEDPVALPAALDRAVRAVTVEKRQALLNVICRGPGV